MTKQNKIIIMTLCSVCILGIIGWNISQKSQQKVNKNISTPLKKENNIQSSMEDIKKEQIKKEQQYAETIGNENQFFNDALNALDIKICDKIVQNTSLKQECIDNVYLALSKEKNEMSYCMKIKDTSKSTNCKNLMYYDLAIKNTSALYCNRIKDDNSLAQNCTTNIVLTTIETKDQNGDTKICDSLLPGSDKEYCINRIKKSDDLVTLRDAVEGNNSGECSEISDSNLKKNCLDVIYLDNAINGNDIKLCEKISSPEKKGQCLNVLGKVAGEAYLKEAIEKNDISICSKITDINLKNKCSDSLYLKKAYQEKNLSLCDKITQTKEKEICISDLTLILKQK